MSTPNPPVKHSVDFINKRKMLTFIPVLGAPFLTAMFWLGGGRNCCCSRSSRHRHHGHRYQYVVTRRAAGAFI